MDHGFPQYIPTDVMDSLKVANHDVSSSALTTCSHSKKEKQKLLTHPNAESAQALFTVPLVRHYALRKP
jgi:hypothetical protein